MSDDFYRALEERFRASREVIRARLENYLPFLSALCQTTPNPKAFDIGCGRGEWLQLLTEQGMDASGVDLDDSMLQACHERGLKARNQDALQALQALPDASLDLISAFHVVEHLKFDYLQALLKEAARTLAPDGLLILETPNAENLIVGTNNFYLDPTHERPVPAVFLEFLCEHAGFAQCKVVRLQEDPALHNPNAQIGVWQTLYGVSPDYAIVARKSLSAEGQHDPFASAFSRTYGLDLPTLAQRHDQLIYQRHEQNQQALANLQHQSEQQVRQLVDKVEQLAELYQQSQEHARKVDQQLELIYTSRSWRITRPVRGVTRVLSQFSIKRMLTQPVFGALRYIKDKPRMSSVVMGSVKYVPLVGKRVYAIDEVITQQRLDQEEAARLAAEPPPPLDLNRYSPRTVALARRLQDLLIKTRDGREPAEPFARPRLAYVSPMPAQRSGIADYSGELLPALARYYDIDVIVEMDDLIDPNIEFPLRDAAWLRENAASYSAVLYHVGNSAWHGYMYDLLQDVPGVLVLHDFHLSGLIWAMEEREGFEGIRLRELYYSHGYQALAQLFKDERTVAVTYPFNRSILQAAQGVIVHSAVSRRLAEQWYGARSCADWIEIPLLRELADLRDAPQQRAAARVALELPADAFVVCSFGMLGHTKLNDRLLDAWLASELAADSNCYLVFVGELGDDEYGQNLRQQIEAQGEASRIRVTGWASDETFANYLTAADLAVQLRTLSRGETSAAVLDCMNHGLATIVNANGSMADLPQDSVHRLPDEFDDAQLSEALEHFRHNARARQALGKRGRKVIEHQHTPEHCARLYHQALETFSQHAAQAEQQMHFHIGQLPTPIRHLDDTYGLAEHILEGQADVLRPRQLLLDVSGTCSTDHHSGIERAAKALTLALLENPPAGVRVEPVYLSNQDSRWHYRYASNFTTRLLGLPDMLVDRAAEFSAGDQLLVLDISGAQLVQASLAGVYKRMRADGVTCQAMLYDLLPATRPELFPPQADAHFVSWLQQIVALDGAICGTETVANELRNWLQRERPERLKSFSLGHAHLGADFRHAAPSQGLPEDAEQLLDTLAQRPTVLMVGTLEPRKGHDQAVEAFSLLWERGVEVNLVIVGRPGWQQLPADQQRGIPQLIERLDSHPENGERLFWLNGASDELLERLYDSADGLLSASQDEGFGLPVIEAAQKGVPVLLRDIPVFREVAGNHASYFTAWQPEQLSQALEKWLARGFTPASSSMPWLTWRESAARVQAQLLRDE